MKKRTFSMLLMALAISQAEAHVSLNNPLGGETFTPGETVNIEWEILISHNLLNWDLSYSNDGGSTWETIQEDIPAGTLSYQWAVPPDLTAQGRIRIVMDNSGTDYEDISGNFTIESVTGISERFTEGRVKVYPNPFAERTTLEFRNPLKENLTLTIYDAQGRPVRTMSDITADRAIVDRQNMAGGLYFFQLRSGREVRATGKLTAR